MADYVPDRSRRRGALVTALIAVVSLVVTGYACLLAVQKQHARAAGSVRVVSGITALVGSHAFAAALSSTTSTGATSNSASSNGATSNGVNKGGTSATTGSQGSATRPVTLTTLDRKDCPAAASACVNLAEKITWLQASGKVSYGPVRMEPGPPGTVHATPTGTFNVAWKAGPTYMSTIYHELIPWAVFFAVGGIAFHEGSLTSSSHGCVHLTMAAAYYYNQHLPVGAEVVVFSGKA